MTPCICVCCPARGPVRFSGDPPRYFPADSESKPAVLPTPALPAAIFGQRLSSLSPVYTISVL